MAFDWHSLIELSVSPLEIIIRGSLVYLFLFIVFRTVLKRDIGSVGMADVLLLVLVADASQNAMSAEYRSVAEGVILISTIVGWNLLFDVLAWRYPKIRHLLQAREICLVRDGQIIHRNLRREYLSVDELYGKLRENGIAKLADVKAAFMESDGSISVIRQTSAGADEDMPAKDGPAFH
jgi:uncharacterized membrane protein YcaP (DUF421 family)